LPLRWTLMLSHIISSILYDLIFIFLLLIINLENLLPRMLCALHPILSISVIFHNRCSVDGILVKDHALHFFTFFNPCIFYLADINNGWLWSLLSSMLLLRFNPMFFLVYQVSQNGHNILIASVALWFTIWPPFFVFVGTCNLVVMVAGRGRSLRLHYYAVGLVH
jgi:hypothetical protein